MSLPGLRLNKRLAELGLASRREADRLMSEGRVRVNGAVVREPGARVLPGDAVEVDLPDDAGPPGYVLNKPAGYVTTKGDGEGPGILSLLPPAARNLPYAGRLDKDSRGLVLLLRDGRLNYAVTAPGSHLEKEYLVTTVRAPSSRQLRQLAAGPVLSDGPTLPCRVEPTGPLAFRIWLKEGRNRQIRRMAGHVGMEVADLRREAVGPLRLGSLGEGSWRPLTASEEHALRAALDAPPRRDPEGA